MKLLVLNWRDPKNPMSGGAEKLNLQIIEPFIKQGYEIVWYAKSVKGLSKKESYKNIEIIRFGNVLLYFMFLPLFLVTKRFGKIDLVLDCIHGVGNLTPVLMPKTRRMVIIYEVAQNIWDETFHFPINVLGKLMEKLILVIIYSKSKIFTISNSTRSDLIKMGIKGDDINVIPMGFDAPDNINPVTKYATPTALFVGRLVEMKGIKSAIKAVGNVKNWKLLVIGTGENKYQEELKTLVEDLNIADRVKFLGFLSEKEKFLEMSKAWILLVPSSREGWGMIIGEANYVGTQVIGFKSPGIIDSAPYYSRKNILVENHEQMSEVLKRIKKPTLIRDKIDPGWKSLHKFVINKVIN